ncbi:MAG: cytochrome c [Candidatus Solibacter usitatus]|nr:cytochrome c [Candidatus Solibacter usitatus]
MRKRPLVLLVSMSVVVAAPWLLERIGARWGAAQAAGAESPKQEAVFNYEQANGKKLFEHYCVVCHGASGEGDGFNAFNLRPKPRDLTDQAVMLSIADQQLAEAISRGGRERGKSNLMPPWGHTLNERQIRYLVAYLRTLRSTEEH